MKPQEKTQEKGVLLIYFRKIIPEPKLDSFNVLLSYRHDMTQLYLLCTLQELIEIPIYENDSFCEIKANFILENEEFILTEKFFFEEMNLSSNESRSFALIFQSTNYKFSLIFDAFYKSSLAEKTVSNKNILKIKIHELRNLEAFLKKREFVNREKNLLKKNISDFKYFLEMRYFQQKFALELSIDEIPILNLREFFFIYEENEEINLNHITFNILECEYERLTLEDDLTFIGSLTLEAMEKPLKELIDKEFVMEDTVHSLIITFRGSVDKSSFLSKMPAFTGIKLLSSTFFDSSLKEAQIIVRNYDSKIIYLLEPIEYEFSKEKTSIIWNFQHSLINSKALKNIKNEPDDFSFEEPLKIEDKKIFQLESAKTLDIFEAFLLKYKYLENYDSIFQKSQTEEVWSFSNKINETFFINEIPYDFIVFELIDNKTKEKKGICEVCLMDLEEKTLNLEFLVDPKDNIIVGSLSFMVEFQSICASKKEFSGLFHNQINTNAMIDYDNFNKLNYTRIFPNDIEFYNEMRAEINKLRGNYFLKTSKITKFHLEIEEIWNCFELFNINNIDFSKGNIDLICKVGNSSYSIPLKISELKIDKIKSDFPFVYKAFFNDKKMQYIEKINNEGKETQKINIYLQNQKKDNFICVSFQKNQSFWVILDNPYLSFSVQLNQEKNILVFYKCLVKDLLIFESSGTLIVEIPVKKIKKANLLGFNSNSVFIKFHFKILENLDYDKQNFSEGIYSLLLILNEEEINRKLVKEINNLNYEILITDSDTNKTIFKKMLKWNNIEGNLITNILEIKKFGGLCLKMEVNKFNIILFYKKKVNRLFSEDDEEYQLNMLLKGLKSKSKPVYTKNIVMNFMGDNKENFEIDPNNFKILRYNISENRLTLNLNSKQTDTQTNFFFDVLAMYKCNKLFENSEYMIYLEIPQSTLQYYLSNGFATVSNSIKFNSISVSSKQQCVFNFKGNNEQVDQISSSIQLSFQIKKYTQMIIAQLLNIDGSINDSDALKIADLIYYFEEDVPYVHTLLFNNKPFEILLQLKKTSLEKKQNNNDQKSSLHEKQSKISAQNLTTAKNSENNNNAKGGKKSELELIKSQIQNFKKENSNLAAQILREQKIVAQQKKTIEELESIVNRSEASTTSTSSKKTQAKPLDITKVNKAKELFNSICICGAANPKFKGYCGECLKKIKGEYEQILNEYLPLNEKLENLSQKNISHLTKMSQMKKKIEGLKHKIKNFDLENAEDNEEKFLKEDINYYKEKKILLEAEIELVSQKFEKSLESKRNEQMELEKKLVKKSEKLQKIFDETENYIFKIKEIKQELLKISEDLVTEEKEKDNTK